MLILLPRRLFAFLYLSLFTTFLLSSCGAPKNVVYFENLQRDTTLTDLITKDFDLKIRKGDVLGIVVMSSSAEENAKFNAGGVTTGYIVDNDGNIDFYKLGKVHVAGLSKKELKNHLERQLVPYLKDQFVSIRFMNHRITVLGEVHNPQVVPMTNEKITLLEVLAMSGDLTYAGRRDNILIIRENNADKEFKRINLHDNSVFSSPFYYLKPDDIVYVEPTKSKLKNSGQVQQTLSLVLTAVSLLLLVFSQVFKL